MPDGALCDSGGESYDGLLAELRRMSSVVADELANRALTRIMDALSSAEIERLKRRPEVWVVFKERQIILERRLHSPYRSLERASVLTQAITQQLRLAAQLADPAQTRLIELVRRHGLSIQEISIALDRSIVDTISDVRAAWDELRRLSQSAD